MKRLTYLLALLFALGFAAPVFAQDLEVEFDDWDTDDLIEDDYGYYDEDFEYELEENIWGDTELEVEYEDDDWDDWYADADDDWFGYDDPGEDGWFDW